LIETHIDAHNQKSKEKTTFTLFMSCGKSHESQKQKCILSSKEL